MYRKSSLAILILSCFTMQLAAQTSPAKRPANPKPQASSSSTDSKAGTIEDKVQQYLRNAYAWGPAFDLKVGPTKPSAISDLLEVPVVVSMGEQSDHAIVYVSKDGKFIFRGELADMSIDPLADVRSKLHPGNSPSMGPVDAKVTLIEFADFECPSCRELDRILRDFLPSHPEIRLVYKHFPLTQVHPWAMTAAIASQCAYQQNPTSFWKMHDAIFDAQDVISPSNVKEKMQDLATQLGLNVENFDACLTNPETAHEIEDNAAEGRDLNISGTPTIFVNGRRITERRTVHAPTIYRIREWPFILNIIYLTGRCYKALRVHVKGYFRELLGWRYSECC